MQMEAMKTTQKIGMGAALGFCLLLMAGSTLAQKVTVDFDKETDFSKYRTYAFVEGTSSPNTLTNQRIERALDTQLSARGLTKVASNADLMVVYHCSRSERTQLNTTSLGGWGWGPGWSRGWGWGGPFGDWGGLGGDAITQVQQIPVGTLIIDIGDSADKRYIWRGTATGTLSSNPQKVAKAIDESIRKMFEKFPPKEAR